jgi:hypothetical protein
MYNVPFPFEINDLEKVIGLYFLGSIFDGYSAGAVTFPFIDINGKIRAIQVKQFDSTNHTTGTTFIHSIIERQCRQNNEPMPEWLTAYKKNERKVTCLFGEHLLSKYPNNPISLVEAPKTAIYGTLYLGFPDNPANMLWLAVYNLGSLNFDKCKALKGRHVYLFPDLSKDSKAYSLWSSKSKELSERIPDTFFEVSDLLEKEAGEIDRLRGSDLADFLIKQDWRKFRIQAEKNESKRRNSEDGEDGEDPNKHYFSKPDIRLNELSKVTNQLHKNDLSDERGLLDANNYNSIEGKWDQDIAELQNFFSLIKLPTDATRISQGVLITDPNLFISSHLSVVKAHNGNTRYLPYLERLYELRIILSCN